MKLRKTNQTITFWLGSPMMGLLIPSAYIGYLFLRNIVDFAIPLQEPDSIVYFVSGIVCMVVVSFFVLFISKKPRLRIGENENLIVQWKKLWKPFFILSIVGGFFLAIDFASTINYGSFNLLSIRQSFAYREATPFAYLSNILTPFAVMLLGVSLIIYEELGFLKRAMGIVIGVGIPIIISLGLGGRSQIVDLVIMIPWWLLQRPVFGKPIFPGRIRGCLSIFVIGVASLWLLSVVSVSRSYAGERQFEEVLWYNRFTITLSPDVKQFILKSNPTLATGITEALIYWSSPLSTFDKLFKYWELDPNYTNAISPVLYRRFTALGFPSLSEIREEQGKILGRFEILPNKFFTATFGLILSFGKAGAFIVQILLSITASIVYVRARREKNFALIYLSSLFFLMFFLWYQSFLTAYPLHEYGFYWCMIFLLYRAIRKISKKRMVVYGRKQGY